MVIQNPDRLDAFLHRIAPLGTNHRLDAMFNECVEVGGCWLGPELTPHWPTTHQIEIHMHGIIGVGPTDDDAIRSCRGPRLLPLPFRKSGSGLPRPAR